MQVSVEVNTVAFEAAMQRLRDGVRRGIIDPQYGTLPVQARLLSERCQDFTPPRNVGQGKAAVARDITRIFRPLSHTTFTDPGLRKIIKTDNRPAWDRVALNFRGSHNLQNTKAIGFSQGWHQSNRISRGRARGLLGKSKVGPSGESRGAKDNLGVVTLGPEGRQARAYIGDKKKMVGWARAGWNAGVIGFGGAVKTPWVSKHGIGGGWFKDGTSAVDPFVSVGNITSWAKYGTEGEGNRILRNAVVSRSRDMQSYFSQMMRVAAKKADPHAA